MRPPFRIVGRRTSSATIILPAEHLCYISSSPALSRVEWGVSKPTPTPAAAGRSACDDALVEDLGWALGVVFRGYVAAATAALADLPGGSRGYQVIAAAARSEVGSQLALAHHLGIDRTVMTYMLDDLDAAGLIER